VRFLQTFLFSFLCFILQNCFVFVKCSWLSSVWPFLGVLLLVLNPLYGRRLPLGTASSLVWMSRCSHPPPLFSVDIQTFLSWQAVLHFLLFSESTSEFIRPLWISLWWVCFVFTCTESYCWSTSRWFITSSKCSWNQLSEDVTSILTPVHETA